MNRAKRIQKTSSGIIWKKGHIEIFKNLWCSQQISFSRKLIAEIITGLRQLVKAQMENR